jgi:Ca-activated chloride channel family protein
MRALSFSLFLLLLAATAARAFEVRIVQPAAGQPLLGEIEVRAEITPAGTRIDKVEFFLDGALAGTAVQAPYRVLIDAGDENREHRLEVVAHAAAGGEARASLGAPRYPFDAEVQVDLQQLFVTVERGLQPVLDLTRDDFTVFDQGQPQPIVNFARGDIPFTAVLLVDSSASMQGAPLEKALDGARAFFTAMAPLDQAKLILFSDHVMQETPFTNIQSVLTLGLGGVKASGGTALNDALYLAVKRLETRRGRKIAVLLSDGVDVESVLSIDEARAIARRQVTLYWLRLPRPEDGRNVQISTAWRDTSDHARESKRLRAAVLESGGRILDLGGIEEIPTTLTRLLQELREQYVLGITPRKTGGKGSWHEVKVEVRGGLQARTQDGYFEP